MSDAPRDGRFIRLHRSNGTQCHACWGRMPDTQFRDPDEEYWLTEGGKFAEVPFAMGIGWEPVR